MVGRVTLTTLPSSADINVPMPTEIKTSHLPAKEEVSVGEEVVIRI